MSNQSIVSVSGLMYDDYRQARASLCSGEDDGGLIADAWDDGTLVDNVVDYIRSVMGVKWEPTIGVDVKRELDGMQVDVDGNMYMEVGGWVVIAVCDEEYMSNSLLQTLMDGYVRAEARAA